MRKRWMATGAALVLLLGACGSGQSGTFETDDGGEGTFSVDRDGGETNISVTGDDGEDINIRAGANVPVDLPEGFSIYPGAKVISNAQVNQGAGKAAMIIMTSTASAEAMASHYRKQAEAAGVEIQMEMNSGGSVLLGGKSPDGAAFNFNAHPAEDGGTTAQLMVGQKMGG